MVTIEEGFKLFEEVASAVDSSATDNDDDAFVIVSELMVIVEKEVEILDDVDPTEGSSVTEGDDDEDDKTIKKASLELAC